MNPSLLFAALLIFLAAGCAEAPEAGETAAGMDTTAWPLGPFTKFEGNPILLPQGVTWEAKDVFNPTAWTDGDEILLLYRAEDTTGVGRWNGTSRLGLARSTDGFRFTREPAPVFEPAEAWELPGGVEDPRLVQIDSTFYLTYTGYDGETARLGLATSPDLRTWTRHGVLFPERGWTKSGAILPAPIDGRYWMYFGDTNIWAAHSDDLVTWTVVEPPVLRPRPGHFDSRLVEPGPAPLLTDDGVLLLYNAADDSLRYAAGQALFDAADPSRLLARTDVPFLTTTDVLEATGQVRNVVFIEGLVRFRDRWFLYFGMGDSGIGVATAE